MVVFQIDDKQLEFENTLSVVEVKKEIIKQLELNCSYIDITFVMDKPSRILGKFNVEPGKLARSLDRYPLERFAFKDTIQISYEEITDYNPDKPKRQFISGGRGRGRGMSQLSSNYQPPQTKKSTFDHNSNQVAMDKEPTFDLESTDDFPSLGK